MEQTKRGVDVDVISPSAKGQMLLRLQSWSQGEVSLQPQNTASPLWCSGLKNRESRALFRAAT